MKCIISLLLSLVLVTGCSTPQRTEITRHTIDMNLVRSYYPDLYEQYMAGEIVIDEVYFDKRAYPSQIGVSYHAVEFVASKVRR